MVNILNVIVRRDVAVCPLCYVITDRKYVQQNAVDALSILLHVIVTDMFGPFLDPRNIPLIFGST
jgi:hypothetical protein